MVRFSGWQQKFGFVFVTISFNCFVFDFMKWKTTKISIKLFYCILFFSNFDCNLVFFHLFGFCFICRLFENLVIGWLSLWLIFFSKSFIHSWLIRLTPCVKAKAYWSFFSLNDIVLECLKKFVLWLNLQYFSLKFLSDYISESSLIICSQSLISKWELHQPGNIWYVKKNLDKQMSLILIWNEKKIHTVYDPNILSRMMENFHQI